MTTVGDQLEISCITVSLQEEAFLWYNELQSLISDIQLSMDNDTWHCPAGAPNFKVAKVYKIFMGET